MPKTHSKRNESTVTTPKVAIARPSGRPFQVRYTCPFTAKPIRLSVGSRSEFDAEQLRRDVESKLSLGIDPRQQVVPGRRVSWEQFRDDYSRLKVATFRSEESIKSAEIRLDVAERILKPKTVEDMAATETLSRLQAELLAGAGGKSSSRSPQTVESYMKAVLAALNWAYSMGWIKEPIRFKPAVAVKQAKGEPITADEFEAMLDAVKEECPHDVDGWKYLLRGIWETGLRLGEAMAVSWDIPGTIQPLRDRNGFIVLRLPATMQKNKREQTIPTIPAFAKLLEETPEDARTGWIFKPAKLRGEGRYHGTKQIGRVITAIAARAGLHKHAHDIRRGFGQKMADSGVPPRDLQLMMRHKSFQTTQDYYLTTDAAASSKRIATMLQGTDQGTVGDSAESEIVVSQ